MLTLISCDTRRKPVINYPVMYMEVKNLNMGQLDLSKEPQLGVGFQHHNSF